MVYGTGDGPPYRNRRAPGTCSNGRALVAWCATSSHHQGAAAASCRCQHNREALQQRKHPRAWLGRPRFAIGNSTGPAQVRLAPSHTKSRRACSAPRRLAPKHRSAKGRKKQRCLGIAPRTPCPERAGHPEQRGMGSVMLVRVSGRSSAHFDVFEPRCQKSEKRHQKQNSAVTAVTNSNSNSNEKCNEGYTA